MMNARCDYCDNYDRCYEDWCLGHIPKHAKGITDVSARAGTTYREALNEHEGLKARQRLLLLNFRRKHGRDPKRGGWEGLMLAMDQSRLGLEIVYRRRATMLGTAKP